MVQYLGSVSGSILGSILVSLLGSLLDSIFGLILGLILGFNIGLNIGVQSCLLLGLEPCKKFIVGCGGGWWGVVVLKSPFCSVLGQT